MNEDDARAGAEEQSLELIPEFSACTPVTSGQALDIVDRIEWRGTDLVTTALSTADRAGVRDAHLRVAATLDALAQRTSGGTGSRIRKLAERWRLTGETLAESPVSSAQEVPSSRISSGTADSRRITNQSGSFQVSSRSESPSQISSKPSV